MSGLSGKYRLDARLGGGGMAEVFVGSTVGAEGFSRKIAIKRVLPGFSENPQFARMFVAEAQLSSRLQHPNIVSVLDFDRDPEQRLFLVMELVEGKDLDALLQTGVLPFSVVIHVIAEVLRGLGYAHQLPATGDGVQGLVHRDVSPHNVLLSWEGAVKVSDFGIAKARAASNATASIFIKGKPAYMSPEQANGSPLDGRSDLFAVGIMLWEMLAGRRLFVGGDTRETLAQVLFAPIPRPSAQRPEVPADLERVAMRLLDRDLGVRYYAAEDAIVDLTACAAAPRAGRDELVAVLGARFVGEAPVRQRRPSLVPPHAAGSAPVPQLGTVPYGPSDRVPMAPGAVPIVAAAPALTAARVVDDGAPTAPGRPGPAAAAIMAAPTRTMAPARPAAGPTSRRLGPGLILGLGMVAAVASALVLFLLLHRAPAGARAAAPTGSAAPAAPPAPVAPTALTAVERPPVAPTPDAAPAPPPDAALAPRPDAATAPRAAASANGSGEISITVDPWALVRIDGVSYATTPVNHELPAGRHTVSLDNIGLKKHERFSITITAGKTTVVERTWSKP